MTKQYPTSKLSLALSRSMRAAPRRTKGIGNSDGRAGGLGSGTCWEALERRELLTAATAWYVSPMGNNANPGTLAAPFQTIQKAATLAHPGDTVFIRAGTYHETVTPRYSGTASAPITFTAYKGENVIVDGADPVTGWTKYKNSIFQAPQSWDLGAGQNQVFVDGKMMIEARWPNTSLDLLKPTLSHVQSGSTPLFWAPSVTDPRMLEKASVANDRIAAAYYGLDLSIPVAFTDGLTHRVALYCADYDKQGRAQTLTVTNSADGTTLATLAVPNLIGGVWLVFDVGGSVSFNFHCTHGPNAVCEGAFLDPSASAPPAPGVTGAAQLVATDTSTIGNWMGVYGSQGYTIADDTHSVPSYASVGPGQMFIIDPAVAKTGIDWTGATINITPGQNWVADTGTVLASSGGRLTITLPAMANSTTEIGGPVAGNPYYLTGKFQALDTPTEWFRDPSGTLYLWDAKSDNPITHTVEAKARQYGFYLRSRSYVTVSGIHLFACTIYSSGSTGLLITGVGAQYLSNFGAKVTDGWGAPYDSGILLYGNNNTISNSTIEYSAGNGITLAGNNNIARNNVVLNVDYSATDAAGVRVIGNGNVVDHNTIYRAGRDGVQFSTSLRTKVTYNIVHDVMLLTQDGGGLYTYGTDGTGSEIGNNIVYNVRSGGYGAVGIFLDNGCMNYFIHNNKVYNTTDAIRLAPPSHDELVQYNDLIGDQHSVETYGTFDMAGSMFYYNVLGGLALITPQAFQIGNVTTGDEAGTFFAGSTLPLPA